MANNKLSTITIPNLDGTTTATYDIDAVTVNGHRFNWFGQNGQPSWLWGGNDTNNMYVYNPSNFSVKEASLIKPTGNVTSYEGSTWAPNELGGENWKLIWGQSFVNTDMSGDSGDIGLFLNKTAEGTTTVNLNLDGDYFASGVRVVTANTFNNYGTTTATINTVVKRDENNFVYLNYINSDINNEETMAINSIYCSNDNLIRKCSATTFINKLNLLAYRETISNDTAADRYTATGIYQLNDSKPLGLEAYPWGQYISMSGPNTHFEVYAPHNGTDDGGIYLRTGWDDDKKQWRKIAWADACMPTSGDVSFNGTIIANTSANNGYLQVSSALDRNSGGIALGDASVFIYEDENGETFKGSLAVANNPFAGSCDVLHLYGCNGVSLESDGSPVCVNGAKIYDESNLKFKLEGTTLTITTT